jgi:hypothetical protein
MAMPAMPGTAVPRFRSYKRLSAGVSANPAFACTCIILPGQCNRSEAMTTRGRSWGGPERLDAVVHSVEFTIGQHHGVLLCTLIQVA